MFLIKLIIKLLEEISYIICIKLGKKLKKIRIYFILIKFDIVFEILIIYSSIKYIKYEKKLLK